MRIVVLGGFGNFGARICRALSGYPGLEVIAASRSPGRVDRDADADPGMRRAHLDHASPDFPAALSGLSPQIVIHCAGPFQGQDYRVALAAISAGAHYIDLADGREFVAGFAERVDSAARAAGLLAVSGASSVPALSSAVVDSLIGNFRALDEIQLAIAPGQRSPRGTATIAAVLGYVGRPFNWLSGGRWVEVYGWQELRRVRFAGLGGRWAAACDVPDLELFPKRYSDCRTVEFRAALELGMEHVALWFAGMLRRAGVPLPIDHWANSLNGISVLLDRFGSERGGMLVGLAGRKPNGNNARIEWHLTADANHGPEIPTMAAILLTQKLMRNEISARGAFPCMGFLTLADFELQFARWRISTSIEEKPA